MEDESTESCQKSHNVQTKTPMNFAQVQTWLEQCLPRDAKSQYKSIQEFQTITDEG